MYSTGPKHSVKQTLLNIIMKCIMATVSPIGILFQYTKRFNNYTEHFRPSDPFPKWSLWGTVLVSHGPAWGGRGRGNKIMTARIRKVASLYALYDNSVPGRDFTLLIWQRMFSYLLICTADCKCQSTKPKFAQLAFHCPFSWGIQESAGPFSIIILQGNLPMNQ